MLRFATFGSARAAVRYFVRDGADCARPCEAIGVPEAGAVRAVDYYREQERALGAWVGRGATALGLTGAITARDEAVLMRLLSGQLPDGDPVARPVLRPDPAGLLPVAPLVTAVQEIARERGLPVGELLGSQESRAGFAHLSGRVERDPRVKADARRLLELATAAGVDAGELWGADRVATAVARAGEKVDVRRAGVDGPLSAPKSVSVLWALADHHTQQHVLEAHRAAVTEAVSYLERWAGHGLRGHQGDGQRAARMATAGLIVAAFEHLTSRADDPQLHTHLVITNLVHGADGKWSALDTRALFRAQRTAGYLYQAVLRGQLSERLGVAWGSLRHGVAEIDGLPAGLLRAFSTRRQAIETRLAQTGATGVKAAQVACLETRPAKSGRAVEALAAGWWTRARAHLADPVAAVRGVLGRGQAPRLDPERTAAIADRLLSEAGLTAHETGFDRGTATRAFLEALPPGTPVDHARIETLVDGLLADERVLPLIPDAHGTRRYTTRDLACAELAALRAANGATRIPPTFTPRVDVSRLSVEQRQVLRAVLRSPARVDVILGSAGAGKTAMLAALQTHYAALGVPVIGACLAAVTACRLGDATGIPSTSLARLAGRLRDGHPLPAGAVLVVDEAGMVGTRHYATLLAEVERVGGKLLAVGDRAQLTEIDAGGMFARLSRTYLRGELSDNHRQQHAWERDALTALRTGDVDRAWTAYTDHQRLHSHPDHDALVDQVATDYLQALDAGTPAMQVVALAATRDRAARLNDAIRATLQHTGRLGPDQTVADHTLAVGELVLVTRNDNPRGLLNGTRATVTSITPRHVRLRCEDDRHVEVPLAWAAERLRPAYAMTVHKAQGLTVDIAIVDATALPDRNAAYVALSRARHRTELHHAASEDPAVALRDDPLTPAAFTPDQPRGHLSALQRLRLQRLAIDQTNQWTPPRRPNVTAPMYDDDHHRGYGRAR